MADAAPLRQLSARASDPVTSRSECRATVAGMSTSVERDPRRTEHWLRAVCLPSALALAAALLAGCTPASSVDRIVLVTIDTLRADHVGSYGGKWVPTPTLDALAERGVRFENAISPAPLTLPSHASLMTGLDPHRHGVRNNSTFQLAGDFPTLAERLRDRGFATAAFIGAVVLDRQYGLARGFDHYDDRMAPRRAAGEFGFSERTADRVVDSAIAWLETAPDRFFLWLHLYDPHAGYKPPATLSGPVALPPLRGRDRVCGCGAGPAGGPGASPLGREAHPLRGHQRPRRESRRARGDDPLAHDLRRHPVGSPHLERSGPLAGAGRCVGGSTGRRRSDVARPRRSGADSATRTDATCWRIDRAATRSSLSPTWRRSRRSSISVGARFSECVRPASSTSVRRVPSSTTSGRIRARRAISAWCSRTSSQSWSSVLERRLADSRPVSPRSRRTRRCENGSPGSDTWPGTRASRKLSSARWGGSTPRMGWAR